MITFMIGLVLGGFIGYVIAGIMCINGLNDEDKNHEPRV